MGACDEALGVSLHETASSADLGGSSKYSNDNSKWAIFGKQNWR